MLRLANHSNIALHKEMLPLLHPLGGFEHYGSLKCLWTFTTRFLCMKCAFNFIQVSHRIHAIFIFGRILNVTGPGKTGLIYTKYTCSYYGTYLLFCMHYPKSGIFIEFLMDFCICDDIVHTIRITDKLLHIKLSKSGQILCIDKTGFPRPGHKC